MPVRRPTSTKKLSIPAPPPTTAGGRLRSAISGFAASIRSANNRSLPPPLPTRGQRWDDDDGATGIFDRASMLPPIPFLDEQLLVDDDPATATMKIDHDELEALRARLRSEGDLEADAELDAWLLRLTLDQNRERESGARDPLRGLYSDAAPSGSEALPRAPQGPRPAPAALMMAALPPRRVNVARWLALLGFVVVLGFGPLGKCSVGSSILDILK